MVDTSRPVNEQDLRELHETFLVYGDPAAAPYWFLGLEEGYQPDADLPIDRVVHSLLRKAREHRRRGTLSLRDLVDHARFLPPIVPGEPKSGKGVKYQSTWGGYIKLLLAVENAGSGRTVPWQLDEVRRYQKHWLGALERPSGVDEALPASCLMELFELPWSRGTKRWPYASLAEREGLGYLGSAARYRRHVVERRVELLLELVRRHRPGLLVCVGADCRNAILPALGNRSSGEVVDIEASGKTYRVHVLDIGATTVVFPRHPTASGTPGDYWIGLGRCLAERRRGEGTRRAA